VFFLGLGAFFKKKNPLQNFSQILVQQNITASLAKGRKEGRKEVSSEKRKIK